MKQQAQQGSRPQHENADRRVSRDLPAAAPPGPPGDVGGLRRLVGNNVNIDLRRVGEQLLPQGLGAEKVFAGDGAPPQNDLRNAGKAGEFRDLIGHILPVDHLHIRPQLFRQLAVVLKPLLVLL